MFQQLEFTGSQLEWWFSSTCRRTLRIHWSSKEMRSRFQEIVIFLRSMDLMWPNQESSGIIRNQSLHFRSEKVHLPPWGPHADHLGDRRLESRIDSDAQNWRICPNLAIFIRNIEEHDDIPWYSMGVLGYPIFRQTHVDRCPFPVAWLKN